MPGLADPLLRSVWPCRLTTAACLSSKPVQLLTVCEPDSTISSRADRPVQARGAGQTCAVLGGGGKAIVASYIAAKQT